MAGHEASSLQIANSKAPPYANAMNSSMMPGSSSEVAWPALASAAARASIIAAACGDAFATSSARAHAMAS